jgi:hypothetical protein
MGNQVAGIVIIKINGQSLRSEPGASHDTGGVSRTEVVGDQEDDVAFAQKRQPSQTDCVLMYDADTSLSIINGWSDVTLNFEVDTGQLYVVNHAFCTNTPKITGGQGGKVALTFKGPPSQEVAAS